MTVIIKLIRVSYFSLIILAFKASVTSMRMADENNTDYDTDSDVDETDQNEDTEHEVFIYNNTQNGQFKVDDETRHIITK